MSKVRFTRPSPAMIVALIALFAALGGSAYAAKKIGTKEIKANAITTGKIKKNAVTTSKIKNEAVTGAKIKESSLGAVPSATHASSADSATTATNWSRYVTSGIVRAGLGQNVTVLSVGPFTLTGHCEDAVGGEPNAYILATTSQGGSMVSGAEQYYVEGDFDPGDENLIGYEVQSTDPLSDDSYGGYYTSFTAASNDGNFLLNGEAVSAVNYYGAKCAFWAHSYNNN